MFANTSENDIILRDALDALQHVHPTRFTVTYCIDKASSSSWKGCTGHVSKEMIQKYMPAVSEDNVIYVCGPPGLMNHVSGNKAKDKSQGEVSGLLQELNYASSMVFKF